MSCEDRGVLKNNRGKNKLAQNLLLIRAIEKTLKARR